MASTQSTMFVPPLNPNLSVARPPNVEPKYPPTISQDSHRLVTIPALDSSSGSFVESSMRFMQVMRVADIANPCSRRPIIVKEGLGFRKPRREEGPLHKYPLWPFPIEVV